MKDIYIVKIVDEYSVVLNVGKIDGVYENNKFMIYTVDDEDIIDPITGENLGRAEFSKGYGAVTSLQEKLCIITSTQTKKITRKNPFDLAALTTITKKGFEYIEDEIVPFKNPKVGDRAKKIY